MHLSRALILWLHSPQRQAGNTNNEDLSGLGCGCMSQDYGMIGQLLG